jgi:serine/threonine protein kinase
MQASILVSEDGRACLADFGLTRFTGDPASITRTSTCVGTIRWCPPELLYEDGHGSKADRPTKKSDIYSMGMTTYEVSLLQYKSGQKLNLVVGSYGRAPVSKERETYGDARHR